MAEIKVGVNTNGADPAKAISEITKEVNSLAKAVAAAGKVPFKPVDVAVATKDLEKLNKGFEQAIKQSRTLREALKSTGQAGKSIQEVDFSKLSVDQNAAQRMRDKAFGYSARGTAWDMGNFSPVPGHPNPARPNGPTANQNSGVGEFARKGVGAFSSGVGGGFGQITNGAIKGAGAGAAEGGGMAGGAAGLLRGGLIGAGIFGLFKAGQAVSHGYDMAKERGTEADTLKRQMGDLGISFAKLKDMSDDASAGLGVNSKEFMQLAEQYNKASHNTEKTPDALGGATRGAIGFSRAYGIDPSQGIGFFGAMRNIDPKQNNRDLALQIAEAVNKSGGRAMAPEVMQFVQTMASSMARLSMAAPNTDAYSAAFGNMVGSGRTGMTSDAVSSILGQANIAISHMGGAGEAGKNFQLGAINQYGRLGAIATEALSAQGLFGTRGRAFGDKNSDLSVFFADQGKKYGFDGDLEKLTGTNDQNRDVTTWAAMRQHFEASYDKTTNGRWLMLNGVQRDLQLNSPQQAAAMMNLDGKQAGGLEKALARAHVKLSDLNEGGIATMAKLGGAENHGDLDKIYADIRARTGKDSLSPFEKSSLDSAQKGGIEEFREALLKVMAGKDQEMTEAKDMLAGIKAVETAETELGAGLIGPTNAIRDAVLRLANKFAPLAAEKKPSIVDEKKDVDEYGNRKYSAMTYKGATSIAYGPLLPGRDNGEGVMSRFGAAGGHPGAAEPAVDSGVKPNANPANTSSSSRPIADIAFQPGELRGSRAGGGANSESDINKLMGMGWSSTQAAAIAANLQSESGSNEKAVGDSGLARGIAQWHPGRQADFAKFAGHDIKSSTHDEQLAFVNEELRNGKYKKVGDKLSHLADANEAGSLISREYESPRDADGEATKRGRLASSLAAAHDSLTVHIKVDTTSRNAQGALAMQTMQTTIEKPRGSGATTVGG